MRAENEPVPSSLRHWLRGRSRVTLTGDIVDKRGAVACQSSSVKRGVCCSRRRPLVPSHRQRPCHRTQMPSTNDMHNKPTPPNPQNVGRWPSLCFADFFALGSSRRWRGRTPPPRNSMACAVVAPVSSSGLLASISSLRTPQFHESYCTKFRNSNSGNSPHCSAMTRVL